MIKKKNILILGGGYGSRLYPLTYFIPKIFLKFKSKYLLDLHLFSLRKIKKNKIYINLLARGFYKRFLNSYSDNKKIEFIIEKKPSGTAGILQKVLAKNNKSDLIMIYSDTFHGNKQGEIIKKIIKISKGKNIAISATSTKKKITDKGVIFLQKNNLKSFIEKPKLAFATNLYFSGLVYIPNCFKHKILNLIKKKTSKEKIIDFSKLILMSRKFPTKVYRTRAEPLDFGKWTNVIKNIIKQ